MPGYYFHLAMRSLRRSIGLTVLMVLAIGVGVVFALALNLWLVAHQAMTHMPASLLLGGVLALFLIGQAAVFVPAQRASRVPPLVATRSP